MFSIQIDTTQFRAELARYLAVSKKDLAEIVNTKAFFIALKALRYTPTAKASAIRGELMAPVDPSNAREFFIAKGKGLKIAHARGTKTVPRIYLIINAQRRKAGKPGLEGAEMKDVANRMLRARQHAVGFEKAGWAWALKELANAVPSATQYASQNNVRIGQTRIGGALPASPGEFPAATIFNRAWPKHQPKRGMNNRLQTLMGDALQQAIAEETASMAEYVRKKMQPTATQFSGK